MVGIKTLREYKDEYISSGELMSNFLMTIFSRTVQTSCPRVIVECYCTKGFGCTVVFSMKHKMSIVYIISIVGDSKITAWSV